MTLLITAGDSDLARAIAAHFAAEMPVLLFDRAFHTTAPENVRPIVGDLREPNQIAAALTGVQAVLHLAPILPTRHSDDITALDEATRGSFVLFNAARAAGVPRIILAGSLALFDRFPAHYQVNEVWRPRPEPVLEQLSPWLAELSMRENARASGVRAICLRFGTIVDDAHAASRPYDPRWVHQDDAIQAIRCALSYDGPHWSVFHVMAAGPRAKLRLAHALSAQPSFGYQPTHDFRAYWTSLRDQPRDQRPWRAILAPKQIPSRPIRRVVIFGAGGPMGAVTTNELLCSYTLRATDLRPIADIAAEARPQAPGAPLPTPLSAPHENTMVDVRDPQQVLTACVGMDAIINCTVVRPDPVNAFLVNTIGAYNVMTAAVAHNIRRIVHTGPLLQHLPGLGDYLWDYDLPVDAPARPYDHLYIHSKYLGQEICRVFAEYYGLEVPALLFMLLFNPEIPTGSSPFMISWPDTGRALRRALEVTSFPAPFTMVNISADLPHGRFDHDKAHRVLDWFPRDGLDDFWQDPQSGDGTQH